MRGEIVYEKPKKKRKQRNKKKKASLDVEEQKEESKSESQMQAKQRVPRFNCQPCWQKFCTRKSLDRHKETAEHKNAT